MSARTDTMYKNHCVGEKAKDRLLDGEERYTIQFSRLVTTQSGKKYVRATVNCGNTQFKEIVEKCGLQETIANRWEIWDSEKKKNISFQG